MDWEPQSDEKKGGSNVQSIARSAIQELLGNAARHAQATTVRILLDMGQERVRVSVDDNGKGFDPDTLNQSNNLGLRLIRERAEMLGGNFEIDTNIGKGTRVSFAVPARS